MRTPRFWQQRSFLSTAVKPLALLYRVGAWADRRFTTVRHATRPVISIGNVTAGGAGKTPTTMAVVAMLQTLGFTPHILTRGYKSHAPMHAHRVSVSDPWQQVGDEAMLLAAAAPTWAGANRLASADAAVAEGANVLVCDDALQHHALHKDISLLVIDGPYGIGNGKRLPAGPLREGLASAMARCDAIVLIGDDAQRLTAGAPIPVFRAQLRPAADVAFLKGNRWLAFAGIGRPEKFYHSLRQLGAPVVSTHDFPDHHHYSTADLNALLGEATHHEARLITTAKDAVKLPREWLKNVHVLPIQLAFDDAPALAEFLRSRLWSPSKP
jgi:tetraacyldisaccharide 4'-kinase